ncbi:MAG: phosphoribosylformylglycinamidine synthase [Bacteroidales bacterium]|jgi:phosphoribosylformylglycinamidine synthase|nr:phosphoribosylformylglycinamidine synthase [Bacteroidales bacterium]
MITFFRTQLSTVIAVESVSSLPDAALVKLAWLFGDALVVRRKSLDGQYIGPRKEMITPWSTNAVEITQNMAISGIVRIEEFIAADDSTGYDPMLQARYNGLTQRVFYVKKVPDPIVEIDDIAAYNAREGLALSAEEISYLNNIAKKMKRQLTDSEVFGFSQVNSEHCRHKIFNGTFIIDGVEQQQSLFQLIKKTTEKNPNKVISAYRDNCSFVAGPVVEQFAPASQDKPDYFEITDIETALTLKAETHNFPTTVEPFNGAATGTGGEIRDRMAGGKGSIPLAGTAVYMTAYPRTDPSHAWEHATHHRPWLYHAPDAILIKASNGASDFGNKFGQPIIAGSVLTFEHFEKNRKYGYDKVVMMAGGVGFARRSDSLKGAPKAGDEIVLLGGDNYRIGMGGGAVSSVATGEYRNAIELNAVQRANPEMQKRACNAIRALAESAANPIISIHDHGAGGHLNCLSELVEDTGGTIDTAKLPVGDPTLSQKEIIGNESQERMGLVMNPADVPLLQRIAARERSPMYVIGKATGDQQFTFENSDTGEKPIDWPLSYMFGKPPKTVLTDTSTSATFAELQYSPDLLYRYIELTLQLESVACKDWLTNKVDRSVTGRIAKQQTAGALQLPLNNVGVVALDYQGIKGIATAIGHAPVAALIDPAKGSLLAIAEALTNIIWAPMPDQLRSVSLSANWMWPAKNPGENARIYRAVEAASDFAIALGINIPTGKDSMSMTQKYTSETVYAPGTVIISASAEVTDICKTVEPVAQPDASLSLYYIDMSSSSFELGGSALSQILNRVGTAAPTVADPEYFVRIFNAIQQLIAAGQIASGHDVSSGGLITTLLEMCFANNDVSMTLDLSGLQEPDLIRLLFSEKPALVIQGDAKIIEPALAAQNIRFVNIGHAHTRTSRYGRELHFDHNGVPYALDVNGLRDLWFKTSYLLDCKQSGSTCAKQRFTNYKKNELTFNFMQFSGIAAELGIDMHRRTRTGIRAAIIREKGVNGDREMAYMLYLAGFDVKDVHMTDLVSGRETLDEVNMLVYVGGFSNSDVLGSAKGWAGAFRYNEKAKQALDRFYRRSDTLSLGVCNGCQLMIELGLVSMEQELKPRMQHNRSGKFESAFVNVDILENNSVMLRTMAGMRLGIWVAHGEGRFHFPYKKFPVPMKYSGDFYPANPNGSELDAAAVCSRDGRHLAMMPHLERAFLPWQWPYYPAQRRNDEVAPWLEAFVNAREWIKGRR